MKVAGKDVAGELVYVIERGSPAKYFCGFNYGSGKWTENFTDAYQFPSREKAQEMWDCDVPIFTIFNDECRIEEHMICNGPDIGREEELELLDRFAKCLEETAIALKGPQHPPHKHSWFDLPKVAQELNAALSPAQPGAETLSDEQLQHIKQGIIDRGDWTPFYLEKIEQVFNQAALKPAKPSPEREDARDAARYRACREMLDRGSFHGLPLNANDTFGYACADSVDVDDSLELDAVTDAYIVAGHKAVMAWMENKTGAKVIPPLRAETDDGHKAMLDAATRKEGE